MKDPYAGRFTTHYNAEYDRMRKGCAWFDHTKHYVVATEDSSGNLYRFVGVSKTMEGAKPLLRMAYKATYKKNTVFFPTLLLNNRAMSFQV